MTPANEVSLSKFTRLALYFLWTLAVSTPLTGANAQSDIWAHADSIAASIRLPAIPDRELPLECYGALGDGKTDCSAAFRRAIDTCAVRGGGTVEVPDGTFLTGPIRLRSNVNLHLSDGTVVIFDRDLRAYLPLVLTRFEGVEVMNYSPLIYAYEDSNFSVTGKGTLNGNADDEHWWPWRGAPEHGWKDGIPNQAEARKQLFDMGEQNVPPRERIFGEGKYLRPSFIEPYNCRNVLIRGLKIINSPMWEIHPVLCENVTVEDVHIDSHGPNNDGCNPESCRNVLISRCTFNTGDDCIAIKSGRNADGRRLNTPSENIIIRGCKFADGHGGVTIGSEMSGGVRNVYVEDCEMESPTLYSALRIKSNAVRGGVVENIHLRNIRVGLVDRAVVDVDLFYEEGRNGKFLPLIRNVSIEGMTVETCKVALNLVGYDDAPLRDFTLKDCDFRNVTSGSKIEHVDGLQVINVKMNGKEFVP